MKERLRSVMSRAIVRTGITAFGRRVKRSDGALILSGHRVAEDNEGYLGGLKQEWLDEQLAYLTRHYEIISLGKLVACFENRRPVPHRSVALTFDDGFRDNLVNAAPLLQKYSVPATIFVITRALTEGELPWSQRLGVMFQQTSADKIQHPLTGNRVFDLSDADRRSRAYLAMKALIARMGRVDRERVLGGLEQVLNVKAPTNRMLNWRDARELMGMGIEIGAHTYSHPLLANIPLEEARWEMEQSRDDLKEQLGIKNPPFCFPAGSMNPVLLDLVPRLGFRSAFVPNHGLRVNNLTSTNQYALSRFGMPRAPGYVLEAELDGPFHRIRDWLADPRCEG